MFAHKSEVTAGTTLTADGGFTCIKPNAELAVHADDTGELFVPCRAGRHYLDGQLDEDDRYTGLTLKVVA